MEKISRYAAIGGGFLLLMAFVENGHAGRAKKTPQELTCSQLLENGYGDNAHVCLTDFVMCQSAYVYEEGFAEWKNVWIPAVPPDSPFAAAEIALSRGRKMPDMELSGEDIKLILMLKNAGDERGVEKAAKKDVMQGLIIHPTAGVSREERELMQEAYPGLDFGECLILVEGERPAAKGRSWAWAQRESSS